MHDAAAHADARFAQRGEFFEQNHAGKTQYRPGNAVDQADGRAEQERNEKHANDGNGDRLSDAEFIKGKNDGDIGKPCLDAGDGYEGRNAAFNIRKNQGQRGQAFGMIFQRLPSLRYEIDASVRRALDGDGQAVGKTDDGLPDVAYFSGSLTGVIGTVGIVQISNAVLNDENVGAAVEREGAVL